MKKILLKLAFKILKHYDIKYILLANRETTLQAAVKFMVAQVETKFPKESGEFKRAQVMRSVMNSNPEAKERDIAYEIELAVRAND